jgi:hypothetical protein
LVARPTRIDLQFESSQLEEHEIMKKSVTTDKTISSEEFDKLADSGSEKIDQYLDWESATRPGLKTIRFNVDVPAHFLEKLDREAQIRGLTRQALVKSWLYRAWQTEGTKV